VTPEKGLFIITTTRLVMFLGVAIAVALRNLPRSMLRCPRQPGCVGCGGCRFLVVLIPEWRIWSRPGLRLRMLGPEITRTVAWAAHQDPKFALFSTQFRLQSMLCCGGEMVVPCC